MIGGEGGREVSSERVRAEEVRGPVECREELEDCDKGVSDQSGAGQGGARCTDGEAGEGRPLVSREWRLVATQ